MYKYTCNNKDGKIIKKIYVILHLYVGILAYILLIHINVQCTITYLYETNVVQIYIICYNDGNLFYVLCMVYIWTSFVFADPMNLRQTKKKFKAKQKNEYVAKRFLAGYLANALSFLIQIELISITEIPTRGLE